jgi:hypothetical protein
MGALAGESQHGCGIVARVRDMSGGRVQLRAGTLFTVLDKLRAYDLVRIDRKEVAAMVLLMIQLVKMLKRRKSAR